MKTRRKFTPKFKAKVALEVLKERESVNEIAKKYELHPQQVGKWKKEFLGNAKAAFELVTSTKKDKKSIEEDKLYEIIGQQKVEIDFFKKKLIMKPQRKKNVR
ncbi:MAG: transposase [Bacteroidota bacterium]|nr:transposase [Bacteroidota bacterium]